ncbi:MAG: hypothetical protein QW840_01930 [Candidatus Bathyarchaeia archaeon]
MSAVEDPATTIIRLLQKNVNITKEDSSAAYLLVSRSFGEHEMLKDYDGQITVNLVEALDAKLELSSRVRRRIFQLRVSCWSVDKAGNSDSGALLRHKMVEEVNRVIRQNRKKPNETIYTFHDISSPSSLHKAFTCEAASDPAPSSEQWTEVSSANYQKLWLSDDQRLQSGSADYTPFMLFKFKIDPHEKYVNKLTLSFEGYGTSPFGNGVSIKVWNHMASGWQQTQTHTGSGDATLTITLTSNCTDYVDSSGYVYLLARTVYSGNGELPGALCHCDFVKLAVEVEGISFIDVASCRLLDLKEFKPVVYCAEFSLKGWMLEYVSEST